MKKKKIVRCIMFLYIILTAISLVGCSENEQNEYEIEYDEEEYILRIKNISEM